MSKTPNLAISIRQPYVEQILRGVKKEEYRSRPTKITGRVYLYASLRPGSDKDFRSVDAVSGDLPTGVIVGSVEIVGCRYTSRLECFAYKLANPKRLRRPIPPKHHPQPVWFHPF